MPVFRLYNTMSRRIEPFTPADGHTVRMYTCGPTVYNPAHLGNFRTFMFEDLLRRVLKLAGWKLDQVMNLTDVDDKIINRAVQQGKTITQVTEPVTEIFHADRRYLRIEDAELYPKATESIPEMIALVQTLMDRGVAYKADDGSIYFAINKFPGYGKLSRLDTREIQSGARVAQDDYTKENAQDLPSGKPPSPKTKPVPPPGILRGVAAVQAGTSSAPPWPCSTSEKPSTFMAAESTSSSRTTRTRSPSPKPPPEKSSPASGATASSS